MENNKINRSIELNNGYKMPILGFGTFKSESLSDHIYNVIQAGVRLIDTAEYYENEKEVGSGIKKALENNIVKREDLFVVTKIWPTHFDASNNGELMENTIKKQLDLLNLDYVDLYLAHWPCPSFDDKKNEFPKQPWFKLWPVFESFVDKKYTKSIGVSNFNVQLLLDLLSYCRIKPVINQVEFHPYLCQNNLLEFCKKVDIRLMAYNSLVSGVYVNDDNKKYDIKNNKTICEISKKHNKTEVQIILNWAISKKVVVIPKSNNIDRVKQNLETLEFKLSNEELDMIDKLDENKRFNYTSRFKWTNNIDLFA